VQRDALKRRTDALDKKRQRIHDDYKDDLPEPLSTADQFNEDAKAARAVKVEAAKKRKADALKALDKEAAEIADREASLDARMTNTEGSTAANPKPLTGGAAGRWPIADQAPAGAKVIRCERTAIGSTMARRVRGTGSTRFGDVSPRSRAVDRTRRMGAGAQPLPEGVMPSSAGAGRGSTIPTQPEPPAPPAADITAYPMGRGLSDLVTAVRPRRRRSSPGPAGRCLISLHRAAAAAAVQPGCPHRAVEVAGACGARGAHRRLQPAARQHASVARAWHRRRIGGGIAARQG
jgi:hypothetical protein